MTGKRPIDHGYRYKSLCRPRSGRHRLLEACFYLGRTTYLNTSQFGLVSVSYSGSHDQQDASLSFPRRRESICSMGASVIPACAGMTLACPKLYDYGYTSI